jgi:membrane-associated protein
MFPSATEILLAVGYVGLFLLIFAETGLLIGLVLPGGETLVFAAGFLSSVGDFNLVIVMVVIFCAAVLADSTEYFLGKKYGIKIFHKDQSLFFDKRYLEEAKAFYEKYGGKAILMGRFIPFIRTLVPFFAGVGDMRYSFFAAWNIMGAFLWTIVISLLGYFLGRSIPDASQYVLWIVLGIAAISLLSPLITLAQNKDRRRGLIAFIKERTRRS